MKARALLLLAVAVGAAASCDSGSDDADPATTVAATSPPSVASSDPPTTTAETSTTSTSTSTTTTTTLPPTTTSPEQVKAEVAAAYLELHAKGVELLMNPTLEGLETRAAEIAVPGSPYYADLIDRVTTLVGNGQFAAVNTPDIQTVTIESVELTPVGGLDAVVVACEVTNLVLMKGPDNNFRPGSTFVVGDTGELSAARLTRDMRLTPEGWRHVGNLQGETPYFPDESTCPAP